MNHTARGPGPDEHRLSRPADGPSDVPRDVPRDEPWSRRWEGAIHRLSLAATAEVPFPELRALPPGWRRQLMDTVSELCRLQAESLALLARSAAERDRLAAELAQSCAERVRLRRELASLRDGERRAWHAAHHDGLTRLPNREGFCERLQRELARAGNAPEGRAVAVLYLDLDGLKSVNDAHGHLAGDQLLRIVAARLSRVVRREDMVCRLGGDEFACLVPAVPSRVQLQHLACKLFDAVATPLQIGTLVLSVRPSIGIALSPGDGATAQGLLHSADLAMYHAKRGGLGYSFFDPVQACGSDPPAVPPASADSAS